jgi:hypothetical protein
MRLARRQAVRCQRVDVPHPFLARPHLGAERRLEVRRDLERCSEDAVTARVGVERLPQRRRGRVALRRLDRDRTIDDRRQLRVDPGGDAMQREERVGRRLDDLGDRRPLPASPRG